MSLYVDTINYGEGFITSSDKETGSITGYPGNIWVVSDNMGAWIGKVGGMRVTKAVAQATVDAAVVALQAQWAALPDSQKNPTTETGGAETEPLDIVLP